MRRSFRFLAVLACALPLACSDTSTAPTAPPPTPRLAANPASNGSVIIRYDDWLGWWSAGWYDPGLNVIGFLSSFDVVPACAGQDPALLASDWKVVQSSKFENLYHRIGDMSEVYVFIYEGDWRTWGICNPIMRGMATAMTTDNDVTGIGGNGANAWGVMANGQVTDGNGQAYRYKGHVRGVTLPNGTYREELSMSLNPLK